MTPETERLVAALTRAEAAEREVVERLIAQSLRLDAALRERDAAREALRDAVELAEEGWVYASSYFQRKWGFPERIAKLRALLPPETKEKR